MKETCKMMVPTLPSVGDIDRHPAPHQCLHPIYADGYCCRHSAKWQEERKKPKTLRMERHQAESNTLPVSAIDAAIILLVKSGYKVERLSQSNADVALIVKP